MKSILLRPIDYWKFMLILILLLTNNSPSNAQMCGQAQLQTCATSSGMCKCCYPGFLGDGTYYLQIN